MLNYKTKQQKHDHNLTMDLTLNNQYIFIYLHYLGKVLEKMLL